MDAALLADLGEAVEGLVRTLENLAALTTDTLQLLRTLPELVRVARYGDVRGTDTGMVLALVDGMVPRVTVGLHAALSGLNAESSAELSAPLRAAHEAIRLSGREELALMWRQALRRLLAEESGVHAVLRGLAARLLFDDEFLSLDEVASLMSLALSPASEPEESAGWLSSFLGESAMVLLHDDMLWTLVDQWLTTLPAERFKSVLPMLRRTFTEFSAPERRQLAERARRAPGSGGAGAAQSFDRDEARAAFPLPFCGRFSDLPRLTRGKTSEVLMNNDLEKERMRRWVLALGDEARSACPEVTLSEEDAGMSDALSLLYDHGGDGKGLRGGSGASSPRVARWLGDIRKYFPSTVVRAMQKDAFDRLYLKDMLLQPEMLESVQPDVNLVSTLMSLNGVIPPETRETARLVVRKVVDELLKQLEEPMRTAVSGALNRAVRSRRPRYAEIDWNRTIQANLRHWQKEYHTLVPESLIGYGRKARRPQREVILCIDQSGSMASSIVYSSISARSWRRCLP